MEIKDLKPNTGNIDLVAKVIEKKEARSFEKFGKKGKVCNAVIGDDSGTVQLTLWNEDIEKISPGDKIHLQNGWCSAYKGEIQLSTGKYGKIEIVGRAENEVFSNDPAMLPSQSEKMNEEEPETVDEEEFIE